MLHGASGARFSYFTFPRLGSYFLMPCQLWHVQQYSLVAFVSVIVSPFTYTIATSVPTIKHAGNASFSVPRCSDSDRQLRYCAIMETLSFSANPRHSYSLQFLTHAFRSLHEQGYRTPSRHFLLPQSDNSQGMEGRDHRHQ